MAKKTKRNKPLDIQAAKKPESTIPNKLNFRADVEIEARKAAEGEEQKLPTFKMNAYNGVPMNLSGFYTPVIVELSGIKAADTTPIFLDHEPSQIVGQGNATISDSAVAISGNVTGEDEHAQKVVTHAKNGFKWQASVGMSITRREILESDKRTTVNGREVTGPMVIARESVLVEVSFVAVGADSSTSAQIAATSPREIEMNEFDKWLQANGFDPETVSDAQRTVLQATFDAREQRPSSADNGISTMVEASRKEQKRQREIATITATFLKESPHLIDEIEAASQKAIDDGTLPDVYELQMLRATRPSVGIISRKKSDVPSDRVIEAAICMTAGLKNIEKHYEPQVLEAANKKWPNRLGLQELLLTAAKANGSDSMSVKSGLKNVLQACFRPDIRAAAYSTISVTSLLSNIANKFVTDAFMAVEQSWRKIAAIRSVSDFKTYTTHSLTGDLEFQEIGPGGEIPHGTLGEEVYTNRVKTHGRRLAITREDIINDDADAFSRVPRMLGRGAGLKINKVFWTAFMDNSTFFTTARGNRSFADDTALSAAGLGEALELWDALTDPDGNPLGSTPRYLVVPTALWETAARLMSSTAFNSGGASTDASIPNANVYAGMFEVVKSSYLSNANIPGYSSTTWYLLADPADIPVIEVAFLNGRDQPIVETADADFDSLGIQMRAYGDFGVSKQEYRGGIELDPSASS